MNNVAPVVLLHGFGSDFTHGWGRAGWPDLLADLGRDVVPVELLGHGASERPHDPSSYDQVAQHALAQLPEQPVDAIGFSAGATTLLHIASQHPERFRRLVLLGVGDSVLTQRADPSALVAALSGDSLHADADPVTTLLWRLAGSRRNDRQALAAFLSGFQTQVDAGGLAAISAPVLLIMGDLDRAHPATHLGEAIPDARQLVVPGLDHFATPSDFRVIDAALSFIGS